MPTYLRDNDTGLVDDVLSDSEELIDALQVERSATFSRILGIEDPLGPSGRDEVVARRTTDGTVAAFQATVSDHEAIRPDVDAALDALTEEVATELETGLESTGLAAVVDEALATAQMDIPQILDAIAASEVAWRSFVFDVDTTR